MNIFSEELKGAYDATKKCRFGVGIKFVFKLSKSVTWPWLNLLEAVIEEIF